MPWPGPPRPASAARTVRRYRGLLVDDPKTGSRRSEASPTTPAGAAYPGGLSLGAGQEAHAGARRGRRPLRPRCCASDMTKGSGAKAKGEKLQVWKQQSLVWPPGTLDNAGGGGGKLIQPWRPWSRSLVAAGHSVAEARRGGGCRGRQGVQHWGPNRGAGCTALLIAVAAIRGGRRRQQQQDADAGRVALRRSVKRGGGRRRTRRGTEEEGRWAEVASRPQQLRAEGHPDVVALRGARNFACHCRMLAPLASRAACHGRRHVL